MNYRNIEYRKYIQYRKYCRCQRLKKIMDDFYSSHSTQKGHSTFERKTDVSYGITFLLLDHDIIISNTLLASDCKENSYSLGTVGTGPSAHS